MKDEDLAVGLGLLIVGFGAIWYMRRRPVVMAVNTGGAVAPPPGAVAVAPVGPSDVAVGLGVGASVLGDAAGILGSFNF